MTVENTRMLRMTGSIAVLLIGLTAGAYGANAFLVTPNAPTNPWWLFPLLFMFAVAYVSQLAAFSARSNFAIRTLTFWFTCVAAGGMLFLVMRGFVYGFH